MSFASVTALTPTSPGEFDATLDAGWTVGGKPNGGYLLALLGRAAALVGTHPHVIAASAHFLRSPEPGPVQVSAEVLRPGRSASHLRARLNQAGGVCVEALLTTAELAIGEPSWVRGVPAVPTPAFADCFRLPSQGPNGLHVAIMDEVDLRLDPACLGFATGAPSGRGELRGHLALLDDEPPDAFSLLYAVDAFPPATFDVALSGWVPTLQLTVYVRALPAPGPVRVLHRAQLIDAGRVDEVSYVWDAAGRLVAHGTQLAGIRLG